MKRYIQIMLGTCLVLAMAGCAGRVPDKTERIALARKLVPADTGIRERRFDTENFSSFAFESLTAACSGAPLRIYIEGDGMAWITSSRPSDDPTPVNPLGLRLFLKDPSPCKLYLARPCQYISMSECREKYWTSHRFSKEVIAAFQTVLDQVRNENGAGGFTLVGYSGGGTVAALAAAGRSDVQALVTVAGNLDIRHWEGLHRLTPLSGSLNPADFTERLDQIPQYHFIGAKDKIIPPSVFYSFENRFSDQSNIHHSIWEGFTHACCWEREWPAILDTIN